MRSTLFAFTFAIAALILLSGCLSQEYRHKVLSNGSSVIEQESTIKQDFPDLMKALKKSCAQGCNIENKSVTLTREFSKDDGYYDFDTRLDFPFSVYSIRLYRIPTDRFGDFYVEALRGMNVSGVSTQPAIDLAKKLENNATATRFRESGIDISYAVEMPADITSVDAGAYSSKVKIKGNTATLNLTSFLRDSTPVTIEAKELNIPLLLALIVLIGLAGISFKFFSAKK